jgi:hypothetical protein
MVGHKVSIEDAAANWYDTVYRPAITLIRKYEIMEMAGDRTEADLYLWMVDHLREVREEFGEEAPARKISHALADYLSERSLIVPQELREEDDDSLILSRTQLMQAVSDAEREAEWDNENGHGEDHNGYHEEYGEDE